MFRCHVVGAQHRLVFWLDHSFSQNHRALQDDIAFISGIVRQVLRPMLTQNLVLVMSRLLLSLNVCGHFDLFMDSLDMIH